MSLQSQYNITEKTMANYSPLNQLSTSDLNEVIKKGMLFSKVINISSESEEALHPINSFIPSNTTVKAQTDGHLLLIDPAFLDRALAWSDSSTQKEQTSKQMQMQLNQRKSLMKTILTG